MWCKLSCTRSCQNYFSQKRLLNFREATQSVFRELVVTDCLQIKRKIISGFDQSEIWGTIRRIKAICYKGNVIFRTITTILNWKAYRCARLVIRCGNNRYENDQNIAILSNDVWTIIYYIYLARTQKLQCKSLVILCYSSALPLELIFRFCSHMLTIFTTFWDLENAHWPFSAICTYCTDLQSIS